VTVVTLLSIPLNTQDAPAESISMWEMLRGLAITVSLLYLWSDTFPIIIAMCRLTDLHRRAINGEALRELGIRGTDEAD
jgi:hypothetical protein